MVDRAVDAAQGWPKSFSDITRFHVDCAHAMADHRITLKLPARTLDGRDLSLEVHIDGRKRGELRISEGGIDWWPRSARKNYSMKSWEELARFMES